MTATRFSPVEVVVVGAGPAGLRAAAVAAERGRRVVVFDQGLRPGGQIWRHRGIAALPAAHRAIDRARAAGVQVINRATVIDVISPGELVVELDGQVIRQVTNAVILATGAKERYYPFPGWTLPGVVGVGGLQALIKSGLTLRGARVVIAGTGPLLFPVAATVAASGADLLLVAEQASRMQLVRFATQLWSKPSALFQGLRYRRAFADVPLRTGTWVASAHGVHRLRSIRVSDGGAPEEIACDWLATSAGLVPNTEIAQLLGCTIREHAIAVDAAQATDVPGVWAVGECTGVKGDAVAMVEGEIAGRAVAGHAEATGRDHLRRAAVRGRRFATTLSRCFALRRELRRLATPDTIICRCEDVRVADVDPRWTQRQAKLWTRVAMGECQGAVCGPICELLFGWQRNQPRPPLGAPSCGAWARGIADQSADPSAVSAENISR